MENWSLWTMPFALLPPVPAGDWVLREHPCGRCGCILRTFPKYPATHACHDKQSFSTQEAS